MPGTITFKPIQANLTHNTSQLLGMDPYCSITIGQSQASGEICHKGGLSPYWQDSITLPASQGSKCVIEIKDKSLLLQDSNVGSCEIDLKEITSQGRVLKWFNLDYDNQPAGEILLEASYHPETSAHLLHSSIEKQAGLGIVGMIPPHQEKKEQPRVEDPTEVIQVEKVPVTKSEKPSKALNQGSISQSNKEFSKQNEMDIEPQQSKEKKSKLSKKKLRSLRKRSHDLDVPTDRELKTRPNYENEVWGKEDERMKDIFLHDPRENLRRTMSEQLYLEKIKVPHIHDKNEIRCDQKEVEGLDLTSELGPHHSGFDRNLWSLPENLKDMKFKSQPPK